LADKQQQERKQRESGDRAATKILDKSEKLILCPSMQYQVQDESSLQQKLTKLAISKRIKDLIET
jgi:hypothetical protein